MRADSKQPAPAPALAEQLGTTTPAAVQAIYDALCRSCGSTLPALIFRNLATRAGVLEAFWECVGPMYQQGLLQDKAWALVRSAAAGDLLPALPAAQRFAFGLEGAALHSALATLDNYNRANPANWLALLTVLHAARSDRPTAVQTTEARNWQAPPPPEAELLPLTPVEQIDLPTRWLLNDLQEGDRSQLNPVVPSMYRHFMAYPALLRWLHQPLAPRFADGRMAADLHVLRQRMSDQARELATRLGPLPNALREPDVLGTMEHFAAQVIPPMVLIGAAWRRAIAPA